MTEYITFYICRTDIIIKTDGVEADIILNI